MDKIQLHASFAMVVIIVVGLSLFCIAIYRDKGLGSAIFGLLIVLWVGFSGWAYIDIVRDMAKYFVEN